MTSTNPLFTTAPLSVTASHRYYTHGPFHRPHLFKPPRPSDLRKSRLPSTNSQALASSSLHSPYPPAQTPKGNFNIYILDVSNTLNNSLEVQVGTERGRHSPRTECIAPHDRPRLSNTRRPTWSLPPSQPFRKDEGVKKVGYD